MVVKVCLNGSRDKAQHPRLPVTVDEYVSNIEVLMRNGVSTFHIHFRDTDGLESLE